jgi:PadR family transcriptional regulator PadR
MSPDLKLSHTAAMILQAIDAGHEYGFSVMETTGLPSGTVYPALRRLESAGLIRSHWESQAAADAGQRPARKYYRITRSGEVTIRTSKKRYPLLARLFPVPAAEKA